MENKQQYVNIRLEDWIRELRYCLETQEEGMCEAAFSLQKKYVEWAKGHCAGKEVPMPNDAANYYVEEASFLEREEDASTEKWDDHCKKCGMLFWDDQYACEAVWGYEEDTPV